MDSSKGPRSTKQGLSTNRDSLSRNRETLESDLIEEVGGRLLFAFFQRPSIDEHKKTRAKALVFLFLMGNIFAPGDDIFILVEDTFDVVLVADDNQGRQCEDDNGKDDIVAWEDPTSQWEDEDSDTSQDCHGHTGKRNHTCQIEAAKEING